MFQINVCTLLCSFALFGLISCLVEFDCKYADHITDGYSCQVYYKSVGTEGETATYSGQHLDEKSDNDVKTLTFYRSAIYFMPKNLFPKFKNIKNFYSWEFLDC